MMNCAKAVFNVILLAAICTFGIVPAAQPVWADEAPAAQATTEDVLHLSDGRVLRGQIINETRSLIIFEYVDSNLNSKTKITVLKADVLQVERDVAASTEPAQTTPKPQTTTSTRKTAEPEATYGATRVKDANAEVARFYIVPMKGQMGTDVNSEVYKRVIDDVRAMNPTVLIIEMDCKDTEDVVYNMKEQTETNLVDFDEYRELVQVFRNNLPGMRQVMWVHDSSGISSMVALSWREIFMKPQARFDGIDVVRQFGFERWQDEDVRGKMTAAVMGWVRSFLENGGYALVLAEAMVLPKYMLSASWKGREVVWSLDNSGEYLVDGNDGRPAGFRAKTAEDFAISKGTAENLDDLALLLGYREYNVVEGQGQKLCDDYIRDWRRAFEDVRKQFLDYEQFLGWANGPDAVKYLGQAKTALERILSHMNRYKAVEIRAARDYGMNKQDLIIQIELLKEQLTALRRSTGGGGRGGGRSGGSGLGSG